MRALRALPNVPRWTRYAWPHLRRALREPRYGVVLAQAGVSLYRAGGLGEIERAIATSRPAIHDYGAWIRMYDTLTRGDRRAVAARRKVLPGASVPVAVVPVERSVEEAEATVRDLLRQIEDRVRVVVAVGPGAEWRRALALRGPRITVLLVDDRGRAALLNAALDHLARLGEATASSESSAAPSHYFVACPGDRLAETAAYRLTEELASFPEARIVYTDEDRLDASSRRTSPCFKPEWSPTHFRERGSLGRLLCLSVEAARGAGGYPEGPRQELDLAMRIVEAAGPGSVRHVPEILVHTGQGCPGSDATPPQSSAHAPANPAAAGGSPLEPPQVTLVMPTRNAADMLQRCATSLLDDTAYPALHLVLVDNGSEDPDALRVLAALGRRPNVTVVEDPGPFNFSRLVNRGVAAADGGLVCLVNNDLAVIGPDWLERMVELITEADVGAVGACLWYPDDTLQHGGIIVGLGGVAGHSHKHLRRGEPGHCGRMRFVQEVSAVTGACMLTRRRLFESLGGLDEARLGVAFNDVDYCLRLGSSGYRVLWTPHADLYHLESASRGYEDTLEKVDRFEAEIRTMKERWGGRLADDPYYNPNLTLDREDFSLAWPPRVVRPWHSGWPPPEETASA